MKLIWIVFATAVFGSSAFALEAHQWSCQGRDLTTDAKVSFTMVWEDWDGSDYTYRALQEMIYDGKPDSEDFDLDQTSVSCGKDDDGNERVGSVIWDLNDDQFYLYAGCENEAMEIEATCKQVY